MDSKSTPNSHALAILRLRDRTLPPRPQRLCLRKGAEGGRQGEGQEGRFWLQVNHQHSTHSIFVSFAFVGQRTLSKIPSCIRAFYLARPTDVKQSSSPVELKEILSTGCYPSCCGNDSLRLQWSFYPENVGSTCVGICICCCVGAASSDVRANTLTAAGGQPRIRSASVGRQRQKERV